MLNGWFELYSALVGVYGRKIEYLSFLVRNAVTRITQTQQLGLQLPDRHRHCCLVCMAGWRHNRYT